MNFFVFYSKIREAYHIPNDTQHRNGMGSSSTMAQHNGSDDYGVVSSTVETDGTEIEDDGSKKLEVNGIVYSVVSEDAEEEEERQGDIISAQGETGMDMDNNITAFNIADEGFHIEAFDHAQEEHYETIDRVVSTGEEEPISNNEVIGNKEKQKELETINDEQSFEQMESTQSSQPSSSSSGYSPSPSAYKKGARVSIHRELDADYERSTDNSNVRL